MGDRPSHTRRGGAKEEGGSLEGASSSWSHGVHRGGKSQAQQGQQAEEEEHEEEHEEVMEEDARGETGLAPPSGGACCLPAPLCRPPIRNLHKERHPYYEASALRPWMKVTPPP